MAVTGSYAPDMSTLERRLRWTAAALVLISLAALVSHIFGILPMVYFLTYFGVPSVLLLFWIAAWAKRIDAAVFLNCLAVGLAGGLVGTIMYDLVRLLIHESNLVSYNGFKAIYIFGSWISGHPVDSTQAAIAGWTYHFWNGLAFGVFYTLAFGRRHWIWCVGYALVIEALMLGLYPLFIRITDRVDFIVLSMIGHVCYGLGLGLVAQKYARNWSDAA